MKEIIAGLLAALLLSCGIWAAAAELDAEMNYDASVLQISYQTTAQYGQIVSFVVYRANPSVESFEDFEMPDDPERQFALTSEADIVYILEEAAGYDGTLQTQLNLSRTPQEGYYILSASGGGTKNERCSAVVYYESAQQAAQTLSTVNSAGRAEMDALIRQKPLFFGTVEDVASYGERILEMMLGIKSADYAGSFASTEQVREAYRAANVICEIEDADDVQITRALILEFAAELGIDTAEDMFTEDAARIFVQSKGDIHSVGEFRRLYRQSCATALLNVCTQDGVDAILQEYGGDLGIDYNDYKNQCEKYGASNINKIFVGAALETATAAQELYLERVAALEETAGSNPGPSASQGGSGGGLSGGLGGGTTLIQQGTSAQEPETNTFSDLPADHWAYTAVMALCERGVINGYEDNTFRPDTWVTREEFVKLLISAYGYYNESAQCEYQDVDRGHWAYPYIASATVRGLVQGIDHNWFGLGKAITREDACVILYRAGSASYEGEHLYDSFSDYEEISSYSLEAVEALVSAGVLNGMDDGRFVPKGELTRAQAAALLYRLLTN